MADARHHTAGEAGFSLIELLVAVAVLSLAAVTMLEHQSQAIGVTSLVEQRALASIVAENRMALALGHTQPPPSGVQTGQESQMGAAFAWRQTVRPAPGGDLMIVDIRVTRAGEDAELAALTGYRKGE
jgi:general secretion pathway protein I